MSGSYVCASCRRRFAQRLKSGLQIRWHQQASFISFGGPQHSPVDDPPNKFPRHVETKPRNNERRAPRPIPEQQPLRSVEDDFLERLLGGRERRYAPGPYSKTREPRSQNTARANDTRNAVCSSVQNQLDPGDAMPDQEHECPASASTTGRGLPEEPFAPADIPPDHHRSEIPTSVPVTVRDGVAKPVAYILPSQLLLARLRRPSSSQAPKIASPVPPSPIVRQVLGEVRDNKGPLSRSFYPPSRRSDGPPASSPIRKTGHFSPLTLRPAPLTSGSIHTTYNLRSDSARCNDGRAQAFVQPSYRSRPNAAGTSTSVGQHRKSTASVVVPDSKAAEHVAMLENVILDHNKTTAESWGYFLELQKYAANNGVRVSLKLRRLLFRRIVHAWCDGQESGLQLTPSLILHRFAKNKYLDLVSLREAMWPMLRRSVERLAIGSAQSDKPSLQELSHELIKLWNLALVYCARCKLTTDHGVQEVDEVAEWETLIHSEQMKTVRSWFSKDFRARLICFFPAFHCKSEESFDSAALITFLVFRSQGETIDSHNLLSLAIQSFRRFIAQLVPYSNFLSQIDRHQMIFAGHSLSQEATSYVLNGLKDLAASAPTLPIIEAQSTALSDYGTTGQGSLLASRHQLEDLFKRRIGRAIEDQNVSRLEKLWHEAQTTFGTEASEKHMDGLPVSLYGQFLTAFMALRRPNRAIEIWNTMMHADVEPTVGAWDAMLKGCGIARDAEAVHDVWSKMVASGIKPDAQIWATRINGLVAGGHWQSGVEAFREMTNTWADEVKKSLDKKITPDLVTVNDINGVPKPNTQTLNGLVAGLARGRKHEELVRTLSWARTLGIKADAYTFNPLFKSAIKDGNTALALKLFNQMQNLNIKPDVATFTMVLQALFRQEHTHLKSAPRLSAPPPATESLEMAAANILQEMKRSGLQANAWTFATLINGLLKGPEGGNIAAAYAVVTYMSVNEITLSSQIYTSLLTYHFNQHPTPDLAAVEVLWNRARMDRGVFLDVVFFDRLIEGFARCGEIGKMMAALAQAGKRGKVPGWIAMAEVVRALVMVGDTARAEEIVARLKEEEQSQDDMRPQRGRSAFWQAVGDAGLQVLHEDTAYQTRWGMRVGLLS